MLYGRNAGNLLWILVSSLADNLNERALCPLSSGASIRHIMCWNGTQHWSLRDAECQENKPALDRFIKSTRTSLCSLSARSIILPINHSWSETHATYFPGCNYSVTLEKAKSSKIFLICSFVSDADIYAWCDRVPDSVFAEEKQDARSNFTTLSKTSDADTNTRIPGMCS